MATKITEGDDKDAFDVAGRGELQLGILIETMRREGFELSIGKPRVVTREENGVTLEPIEEAIIDVDDAHTGIVIETLSSRRGELVEMRPSGAGRTRLRFNIPTRGLIGYQPQLLSDTRGTVIMNRNFHAWEPYTRRDSGRRTGVLLSNYAGRGGGLCDLQPAGPRADDDRPRHARLSRHDRRRAHARQRSRNQRDEGKAAHHVRASGKDEATVLIPPMRLSLERALSYIEEDELVEVTPKSIRLRKVILDPNDRKRAERAKAASAA